LFAGICVPFFLLKTFFPAVLLVVISAFFFSFAPALVARCRFFLYASPAPFFCGLFLFFPRFIPQISFLK